MKVIPCPDFRVHAGRFVPAHEDHDSRPALEKGYLILVRDRLVVVVARDPLAVLELLLEKVLHLVDSHQVVEILVGSRCVRDLLVVAPAAPRPDHI
jgi:hypothetical protein